VGRTHHAGNEAPDNVNFSLLPPQHPAAAASTPRASETLLLPCRYGILSGQHAVQARKNSFELFGYHPFLTSPLKTKQFSSFKRALPLTSPAQLRPCD
jgi:hypothetical protein